MRVYQDEFETETKKRTEVVDITGDIEESVRKSRVKNGICLIFVPHATAAIVLEENESGLIMDMEKMVKEKFPRNAGYEHDRIDDNADSHLGSGFIGQSRVYPVKNGKIFKGTWQNALLLELDGPRKREISVTVIGE